jgi:hypothetical protein
MNIDERLEALTMNLELAHRDIQDLLTASKQHDAQIENILKASRQDGENIRGLARIAEIHEQRLSGLEDQQ